MESDILKAPTEEESRKGAELCLDNASSLIADAEVLLKRESYGHAVFLTISAIEEAAKAYVCAINRIEGDRALSDELKDYTHGRNAHRAKFDLFISYHFMKAIGKAIEKPKEINKPLDTDDLVEVGKDLDSASNAIGHMRLRGLYADFKEGKWVTPSDFTSQDAESWIVYAKEYKEQMDSICRNILDAPLDLVKVVKKFIDQLQTAYVNGFHQNAEILYKNGKITKELYDRILSKKKNHED
jgi:AbiV family abortive infection protein